ncbi:MAG TPA: hypothetical protein VMS23_04615, partial [Terrimicrobiaceae bacterium]|nr:hypothetical protein [Terrimicrobiaceae bacterium]
ISECQFAFSKKVEATVGETINCQVAPHGGDLTRVLRRPVELATQSGHSPITTIIASERDRCPK